MATLEKIRSKSVILFTVIIVALLAFILGDFFNSSRSLFGPGTTAAKVDGHKIDIHQFNSRVESARQRMQDQGYNVPDLAILQSQVLNEMVYEALFNEELDRLGIVVTDNELSSAMTGATALPGFVQQIQLQFGIQSPDQFHDMAFNPGKYQLPPDVAQQLQTYWINYENDIEKELKQQKLAGLFMGAITANKLDARSMFDDEASTSEIEYAKVDYNSLSGDEFKPTDAEINAKYNELKNRFRLDRPVRKLNYIVVDIVPSSDDILKAEQSVEEALSLLNTQEGIDGLSGMFVANNVVAKKSGHSRQVANALDSLEVGQAKLLSFNNNTYTLAKLLAKNENQLDSVKLEFAVFAINDAAQRDSIIGALNAGGKPDDMPGVVNQQPETTVSLLDQNGAQIKELIADAVTGRYFTPDTAANAQQVRVFRVNGYTPAVTTYEVAEITYQVDPSSTTINGLTSALRDFITENNTAAKFAEQAAQAGYHIFPAQIDDLSLSIGNLPDTRGAVKWALNAKKGQVSNIYGDDQTGSLIAVALNDIYDNGFTPVSDPAVNEYVASLAANDKKAAKLLADYQGKGNSVAQYAAAMNTEVDTTNVTFGRPSVSGFPINESELIAAVASAPQGKLQGPIKSNSAVVVFQVNNVDNTGREFNYDVDRVRFNQQQGAGVLGRNLFMILLGNNKVENNLLQFYQD